MKTKLYQACLLASLSIAAMQPLLRAQSAESSPGSRCEESHRSLAPRNPRLRENGSIVPGQTIVQAKFEIDENTTIRVVEYPRLGKNLDSYNSTIIVQRGQGQKKYPLAPQIKGGEVLRLVETASLCISSDEGAIVLAFEAGSTGAAEGFAVIRYSAASIDVKVFPIVTQGKLVVDRATSDRAELWSTTSEDAALCEACKKHYVIRDCQVGQLNVQCTKRAGAVGPLAPDKFMQKRIEIR